MESLVLNVSPGNWIANLKSSPGVEMVVAGEVKPDSIPERILAYLSFYVLIFTAFCVFLPVPTGNALASVRQLDILAVTKPPVLKKGDWGLRIPDGEPGNWQLRGTITPT
jgi:hypothetical protein